MGRDDGRWETRNGVAVIGSACPACGLSVEHWADHASPAGCMANLRSTLDAERRAHAETRAVLAESTMQSARLLTDIDTVQDDLDRLTAENAVLREAARRLYEVSAAITDAGQAVDDYQQASEAVTALLAAPHPSHLEALRSRCRAEALEEAARVCDLEAHIREEHPMHPEDEVQEAAMARFIARRIRAALRR